MEEVSNTIKCSFCIRDLSKITRVACAECPAVLCVKCFQFGSESGKHKRGHNYEILDTEERDTLFNRQWGREDEQNLIQTVHRYKLGNWDEVSQVISKGDKKRAVADVSRHFQLYFVQSTLGRTAMKEKEWIERRNLFKDDISKVISDPSGRELYYHAVVEALRNVKELPDLNDEDIVHKIDQVVRDYFSSLNRTERKRKASELGAVLSKSRVPARKEVFPYGESDDDAWWERIFKEPREKKEVDRYYEENSVCMEEKCMAEAVGTEDMTQIMKMMKDAGIEDHECLGEELKALRLETFGAELPVTEEKKSSAAARETYTFISRLDRTEPETKRAKMALLESSSRPLLPVDLKQDILVEAVIEDEEALKQLEGKNFFEATMHNGESESDAEQETSCDEAEEVADDGEEDSEVSSATDSDSEASHTAVFDYEAYEAKMRAAGYATDQLYSDWDEESKLEISAKLMELAQRGELIDSSEEADDEEEEEEEKSTRDEDKESPAEEDSPVEDDDEPCGSSSTRKHSVAHCGLESEASEEDDEEDVESHESELDFSEDDDEDSPTTSSSSLAVSECESETERLDTLFGAPAMHIPRAMRKEKKRAKRVVKFYELGSDDEYHTMDEDAAALPMAEMTIGESRRRAIGRRLRKNPEKYYDRDPETGQYIAKIPLPPMSPDLAEIIHKYTHRYYDRMLIAGHVTPPSISPTPTAETLAEMDKDRTPEARFGEGEQAMQARFPIEEGLVHADHPEFIRYVMERFMLKSDGDSECSSDDCHSISSETGDQLLQQLGYPLAVDQRDTEVYEDAKEAPEGENDDQRGGHRFVRVKEEPIEEGETTRGWNGRAIKREVPDSNDNVAPPNDANEREIKQEEPEEQAQAKSQPSASFNLLKVKTEPCQKSPKEEPVEESEQQKKAVEASKPPPQERLRTVKREKCTESPKDNCVAHAAEENEQEEGEQMDEEDSEGMLYKLAEGNNEDTNDGDEEEVGVAGEEVVEDEGNDHTRERTEKATAGEKVNTEDEDDFDCARDVDGIGMRCACQVCTKARWTETLGEKEHDLWAKIKKAGLSFEEVKEKLRRHFVDDDSDSSELSDSRLVDEDQEPEEVYVDAVQLNDTDWKLNLNSINSPIPVKRGSHSSSYSDGDHLSPPPAADDAVGNAVDARAEEPEDEKMEVVDESSERPSSSAKTVESAAMNEASLCGLEEEKEEDEDEEEEDKDKTPPMLSGDDKKKGDDESEGEGLPRTPVLVIKKIHARGRTNLRVETRPRTPQDDKKTDEREEEEVSDTPSPAKKKKISKEFQLLFKDLEIRKWEESQAKNLKERATKSTGRAKATRGGVVVPVSDSETDRQDPRKKVTPKQTVIQQESDSETEESPKKGKKVKVKGGRNYVKLADRIPPVDEPVTPPPEDLPRSSRRDSNAQEIKRKASESPKKGKKDSAKKGTKRAAEESEIEEQSTGEEEDTNEGESKSPSKKRRKNKRIWMSKKERKAKWAKKMENRQAREEKRVEQKKAVVSNIQFFEQHEITFFSNVFRRIPFDYEDHGFRNRVNFKSWVNEIYNMGYNQDRDDFDFEYYNDAEQIVSRLNITNCEGGMPIDLENEIKLAKVDRYLRVLQERRALRNQAAEYESVPDFLQLCRRMNSERRKLKDIIRSKPEEEKFDNKLSSVLARDEVLEMKLAKQRLLKIRSRTDKLKELHAAGVSTLEGHESVARFKPRTKFGRNEEQKKVDERERGTLLQFDEKIACQLEKLSLVAGHSVEEEGESSTMNV